MAHQLKALFLRRSGFNSQHLDAGSHASVAPARALGTRNHDQAADMYMFCTHRQNTQNKKIIFCKKPILTRHQQLKKNSITQKATEVGVLMSTCNPSTQKAKTEG